MLPSQTWGFHLQKGSSLYSQGPWGSVWLWCHLPILCVGIALPPTCTTSSEQKTNLVLCHCHFWSAFCLAVLCQEVLFPVEAGFWGDDQSRRWSRTRGQEGTTGTWSLWLCVPELLCGYQCLKPSGNTLSFFSKHKSTNLPIHILCQTCQLLQGLRTACKRCLLLFLWWRGISLFNSSAFSLVRGINTKFLAIHKVLAENMKLTWTVQWPS